MSHLGLERDAGMFATRGHAPTGWGGNRDGRSVAAVELSCGNRHDCLSAPRLIATVVPQCLLADKAYDADAIREDLSGRGAIAAIPSKANRRTPAAFDKELYKARSAVECTFNLLKQARRFATR